MDLALRRLGPRAGALTFAVLWLGCATPSRDRGWVADELTRRTGHAIRTSGGDEGDLPDGVSLEDGLDEDEVVALALWNSPTFAADMARLRAATADFDEAARIDNPRISALGPLGVINAAASFIAPIMSLFQLPQRTEAAGRALESVAESLVQSGLDLARDARLAHVDRALAEARVTLLAELAAIADNLGALAEARSASGDVNPADALAVRAQAFIAADAAAVAARELEVTTARLQAVVGGEPGAPLTVVTERALPDRAPPLADLLPLARAARPDLRAAELELEGAAARAGWERSRIVSLSVQADAQWNATAGGVRVGGVVDLPIFNQNQGGVGRAAAAIERAAHRVDAVRQQVGLEVVTARAQLEQSLVSYERYERDIVPPLEATLAAATQRYELGDDSYLVVLDASGRLGAARLRLAELEADVRRAHAQLERAVGARLEIGDGTEDR
ncbi:MAG: TolC family protein [Sandaracinaceae bacterium]|nr:TolC family protein [Sandaracinaceae bacterium]